VPFLGMTPSIATLLGKRTEGSVVCDAGIKILPVVLYGCEAWSLTLREERKLSV